MLLSKQILAKTLMSSKPALKFWAEKSSGFGGFGHKYHGKISPTTNGKLISMLLRTSGCMHRVVDVFSSNGGRVANMVTIIIFGKIWVYKC